MNINGFLEFINNVVGSFMTIGAWLTTPIVTLGDFSFSPLTLFTFGGISAFIVVAIVKWAVS